LTTSVTNDKMQN